MNWKNPKAKNPSIERSTTHTQKKKTNDGRISALTKPLHSQVIYDIEIDDNFYYMHFRLNLRNKIVDYFFFFFRRCWCCCYYYSISFRSFHFVCFFFRCARSCLTMFIFFDFTLPLHSYVFLAVHWNLRARILRLNAIFRTREIHRQRRWLKGWKRRASHFFHSIHLSEIFWACSLCFIPRSLSLSLAHFLRLDSSDVATLPMEREGWQERDRSYI